MRKALTVCAAVILLACGGQEPGTTASEAEAGSMPDVAGESADAIVADCLRLVEEGSYAEAVPVCLDAVERAPDSEAARAALVEAQAEISSLEESAMEGAAEIAAEVAESAAEEAAEATLLGQDD